MFLLLKCACYVKNFRTANTGETASLLRKSLFLGHCKFLDSEIDVENNEYLLGETEIDIDVGKKEVGQKF